VGLGWAGALVGDGVAVAAIGVGTAVEGGAAHDATATRSKMPISRGRKRWGDKVRG